MIAQLTKQHQSDGLDVLESAVRRRLGNRVRGFRLLILGEGLVLIGQATSYYAKQLEQHAVMEATCVAILENKIVVCDAT